MVCFQTFFPLFGVKLPQPQWLKKSLCLTLTLVIKFRKGSAGQFVICVVSAGVLGAGGAPKRSPLPGHLSYLPRGGSSSEASPGGLGFSQHGDLSKGVLFDKATTFRKAESGSCQEDSSPNCYCITSAVAYWSQQSQGSPRHRGVEKLTFPPDEGLAGSCCRRAFAMGDAVKVIFGKSAAPLLGPWSIPLWYWDEKELERQRFPCVMAA